MLITILGATVIGLTLGLLGSGGSILTIPILVYLLGHESKVAVAESLAIVGSIALVGVWPYARSGLVRWRSVVTFGLPGILGTYWGAQRAATISGTTQLIIFAVVMLFAAAMMFLGNRKPKSQGLTSQASRSDSAPLNLAPGRQDDRLAPASETTHPVTRWAIALEALEGLGVGVVTGVVGVGGGFLIVPALVLMAQLSMREAVGTSLLIIVINSISGFIKHWQTISQSEASLDFGTIGTFIAIGIVGMRIGQSLHQRLDPRLLRHGFALFLVAMAGFVLFRELVLN